MSSRRITTEHHTTEGRAGSRRPDLDGVRGVAILLVLVGHGFVPYGLGSIAGSGVTLFFGLSGYLITGMLLKERSREGRIRFGRFYARRFTRLAPPLIFVVAVVAVASGGLAWDSYVAPLTWTSNYFRIAGFPVYLFAHTWSLSVEEQFYLLWPLALTLLMSRARPVRLLGAVFALLMAWRLGLLISGHLNWAYTATETAGTAILAGCLVALTGWRVRSNLLVIASIALLGILALASRVVNEDGWLWAPFLVTPLVAVILAGAPSTPWLKWRWLGFLGVASYSLYLWHEPIAFMMTGREQMTPLGVAAGSALGLGAYFAVERPVMRWRERRQGALHQSPDDNVVRPRSSG